MSITLKPILSCQLGCAGCYQSALFERNGRRPPPYDLDRIAEAVRRGRPGKATLHGGEILLMPAPDLRRLCEILRANGREIGMQTNALALDDAKLAILREFRVTVGVSINGPGDLNRDRRALGGGDEATDRLTERVVENIARMHAAGLSVSGICVLSETNAGDDDKVERLIAWATEMGERYGMWWFRFNPLYVDPGPMAAGGPRELSAERLGRVWRRLAEATFEDPRREWMPFREMLDNLCGFGVNPCWYQTCEITETDAVYCILGDGEVGNCQRTSQRGISYLRVPGAAHGQVRQQILAQIPMEAGGCGGCRWWRVCYGGAPCEAEDGDWRNRSRFCRAIQETYEWIERRVKGLIPNWIPVPDWTTNDERRLLDLRVGYRPDVDALRPLRADWSEKPSTYLRQAWTPQRPA
jgi:uncharacterized protein